MASDREDYGGRRREGKTAAERELPCRRWRAERINVRPSFAGEARPVKTRKELLTMYVKNIRNRYDWGQMDREVCLRHGMASLVRMK